MATKTNKSGNVPKNINTLVSNVQEDPELTPLEKETITRWAKPDEFAHIFTQEGSLIRKSLRHAHIDVERLLVLSDSGQAHRVDVADYTSGPITGVWGRIPVQAIKVQSACRAQPAHCHVIGDAGLVYP